jgi:hypothetical protein
LFVRVVRQNVITGVPGHPPTCPGHPLGELEPSDSRTFSVGMRAAQAATVMSSASLRRVTAASSKRTPMTVDEWAALDEDVRGELVDGVLVEEEMPSLVPPGRSPRRREPYALRPMWSWRSSRRVPEVWELGTDGRYVRACAAVAGKVDSVPGCEGLALDLDPLWAEVDRVVG